MAGDAPDHAALVAENERLRQQLQHFADERVAQQQRFYTATYMTSSTWWPTTLTLEGMGAGLSGTPTRDQTAAEKRALGLLEERIGADAVARVLNGGAYAIKSRYWPDVVYYVPKDPHHRVRVMQAGSVVMESCLVTTDPGLPWADIMLQRIMAIMADESVLVETGVVHDKRDEKTKATMRRRFNSLMRRWAWSARA